MMRLGQPLGVILMRFGITKVHEDTVAHVLGDETSEATHGLRNALLISRNDLARVFRVHAGRECRGVDQVGEHHCNLAALGAVSCVFSAATAAIRSSPPGP